MAETKKNLEEKLEELKKAAISIQDAAAYGTDSSLVSAWDAYDRKMEEIKNLL